MTTAGTLRLTVRPRAPRPLLAPTCPLLAQVLLPFGLPTEPFFFGAIATFFEVFLRLDDLVFFFLEVVEVFPAIKLFFYYGFY